MFESFIMQILNLIMYFFILSYQNSMIFRVFIPLYQSQSIYTKKREEQGNLEKALKFWVINACIWSFDFIEPSFLNLLLKYESQLICYLFLLGKAGLFIVLFMNNFEYSGMVYDWIVPIVLPPIMPFAELIITNVNNGFSYLLTNITPALAQTLASQFKNALFYLGAKLISKLEFKAALAEPAPAKNGLMHQPEPNRMAMSFIAEEGEDILSMVDKKKFDPNVTQIMGRQDDLVIDSAKTPDRTKFKEGPTI